jgi:hydroxyquinol 1,2-dioxygenase
MDFTLDSATPMVSASFDETPSPRTREIMQALTRHLHAFILDAKPTLEEWNKGIEFLTEVGHWCTDVRQEFVMFSDVMGVSMLVETLNGEDGGTESTVLGPFHMTESPVRELGDNIDMLGGADPCVVSGRIVDVNGTPIPDATLDIWQCTDEGFYDVQQPDVQPAGNGRGLFRTDEEGRFWFRTVVPSYYPVPTDGPVGRLLGATLRHPYRPAHIHFIASAKGFREVTSQVFVADSPYIDSDTVFAVKDSLVVPFRESGDAEAAQHFGVEAPFVHGQFEIALSEESAERVGEK